MFLKLVWILAGVVVLGEPLGAVSVLSHEELIDITWQSDILPLLSARFPDATPEQLKKAHSFAYGGSVIQDLGYYPLGNEFFTNLVHYVRSGDFVLQLIHEASDANEYAFALGTLSHYVADNWGHVAINLSEPILYPSLQRKYGNWVTYEDDKVGHLRTEFSFDVLEVAKHRYNSQQYHDFIGFDVSENLLERAFRKTYGIALDEVLHYDDLTLETFRFAVAKVIPEMTEVALATRKPEIAGERPDVAKKKFVYHLSRTQYEKQYGNKYRRPGIFARILALLIRLVPFGPAKILGYRNPTPQAEDYFFRNMDKAIDEYRGLLRQVKNRQLEIANRNLDTGRLTRIGEYKLCDRSYAELLERMDKDQFRDVTPETRADILAFFAAGNASSPFISARDWTKVESALQGLKALRASSASGE